MKTKKTITNNKLFHYFVLTFTLLSTDISGQCKTKKDEFSNETVIEYHNDNKFVGFESRNGKISIQLKEQYEGQLTAIVPKGTLLLLKLEDEQVLKLFTTEESLSKPQIYADGVYTDYIYKCEIDKGSVAQLAASKTTIIRFPDTKGGTKDVDCTSNFFEKQRAKSILKGAKCIIGQYMFIATIKPNLK